MSATATAAAAATITDIGYISWSDPDGWMNAMSGPAWDTLVAEEAAHAGRWLRADPALVASAKAYRSSTPRPTYEAAGGEIHLTPSTGFLYRGRIGQRDIECFDVDVCKKGSTKKKTFLYVYDIGAGAEHCRLQATGETGSPLWHKDGVSEQVAVVGERVYYLRVVKRLWANLLCSCNAETGADERIHYKETDGRWNLTLFKGPARQLFVIRENSGTLQGSVATKTNIAFKPIDKTWDLVLGPGAEHPLLECAAGDGHIVTKSFGQRTLWAPDGKDLFTIKGHIWFDPFQVWDGVGTPRIYVDAPNMSVTRWEPGFRPTYHSKLTYEWTKSADGTKVPFLVVSRGTPRALLVIGYGAYGLPTSLHDLNTRWGIFLDAGFAIALALIRGGGDDDAAWHKAAQRSGRWRAFDDFEACIRGAQKVAAVGPQKTVIYGRSAGGFLVGATLNRHAGGDLFRGAYVEVPYVDVLNTTANTSLPLTVMEYEEFGAPRESLKDLLFLLESSPCEGIPSGGAPHVAVLARSALNDSEVYAYEPAKWIRRLRKAEGGKAAAAPKLLVLAEGEGHFAPEESMARDEAEDLAFWLGVLLPSSSRSVKKSK